MNVRVLLGAMMMAMVMGCEKKEETPATPAPATTPAATVAAAPAATETVAPVAPITPVAPAKGTAVRVVKTADGGTVLVAADGGIVDAAAVPSLAQQGAALASAAGLTVPPTMPSVLVIPSAITLPTALPSGFPSFPGATDAGKK